MKDLTFAIITPSYRPDFARCQLLSWSMEQFLSDSFPHFIIVPQRDLPLFQQLARSNTHIIAEESLLPWWIWRVPGFKFGRLSLKTIPVRNWVLQQILKVSIAQIVESDVLIFIDSDVALVRPLDPRTFLREDKVRLRMAPDLVTTSMEKHCRWHQTASRLLGLPAVIFPAPGYIGNMVTWRRSNVLKMYEHIEKTSGRHWTEALASSWHLSEYILYGNFVDRILKENSGHYHDASDLCHNYWSVDAMSDGQLQAFFGNVRPDEVAVMISAKARISVERYQSLLRNIDSL